MEASKAKTWGSHGGQTHMTLEDLKTNTESNTFEQKVEQKGTVDRVHQRARDNHCAENQQKENRAVKCLLPSQGVCGSSC